MLFMLGGSVIVAVKIEGYSSGKWFHSFSFENYQFYLVKLEIGYMVRKEIS